MEGRFRTMLQENCGADNVVGVVMHLNIGRTSLATQR